MKKHVTEVLLLVVLFYSQSTNSAGLGGLLNQLKDATEQLGGTTQQESPSQPSTSQKTPSIEAANSGQVGAYDEKKITEIREWGCDSCDLTKANLAGANLRRKNMTGAGFRDPRHHICQKQIPIPLILFTVIGGTGGLPSLLPTL